jgi:hypothetical protein
MVGLKSETEEVGVGRFKESRAREIMAAVLKSKLTGVAYHADNTSTWAREIADEIKSKLKDEGWKRYKFVCQVVIGEQRGQGTRYPPPTSPITFSSPHTQSSPFPIHPS